MPHPKSAIPKRTTAKHMTTSSNPAFCAAYLAIEKAHDAAHAEGRPLFIEEAMDLLYRFPATRRELEEISKELSFGERITDLEIAKRLNMPLHFVQAFLGVIKRSYGDGDDPATTPAPKPTVN